MRASEPAYVDALQAALQAHVVEDPDAPPNFSVKFASTSSEFHILYRGECPEVRTLDPSRLFTALRLHLDGVAPLQQGLVRFQARAVVRDGRATLLPSAARESLMAIDRRLRRAGLLAVDAPSVTIDLESTELVIEPSLQLESAPLAELAARLPEPRRTERHVGPGRYPIDRWVFLDPHHADAGAALTQAQATFRAWHGVVSDHVGQWHAVLEGLLELFSEVEHPVAANLGSARLLDLLSESSR